MKRKTLISSSLALAALFGLAAVVPAMAQTTPTTPPTGQHGNWQGQTGMHRGIGMGMGMKGKPAVVGTVASIDGTTLTVNGRQGFGTTTAATLFTVDASNATVMKNNATSTVASIATGDTVLVQGTISGTNITATSIRDGVMMRTSGKTNSGQTPPAIQGNGQPVVAGTISTINGSSITVTNKSNVSYTVDVSNAKILEGQTTGTLSNLKVGDSVVIQGTVNGNAVTASTVIDQVQATTGTQSHSSFFGGIGQFFKHLFGF